ncbi:MAG: hypothetical protein KJZ79_19050, partial [Bryobacteraceae bacterium]|nr:hypothetical protein [Bryobacteraceae bacterium]
HWSFRKPVRPPLPAVKNEAWTRNPIDRFLLARLEAAGLAPAPEAPRPTRLPRAPRHHPGQPPPPPPGPPLRPRSPPLRALGGCTPPPRGAPRPATGGRGRPSRPLRP